jgi:hypothetical protein
MTGQALASDDPIIKSVDTLISEGCLLSWYIMDIHNQPTELAISKFFLIRDLRFHPINSNQVPVQNISNFKRAIKIFKDPINHESSQD